jgi:hypothetical protein
MASEPVLGEKNRAARAAADGVPRGIEIVIGTDPLGDGTVGAVVATALGGAGDSALLEPPPPPQPAIASVEASAARCRAFMVMLAYWTVTGRVAEFGTHCSVVVPIVPEG